MGVRGGAGADAGAGNVARAVMATAHLTFAIALAVTLAPRFAAASDFEEPGMRVRGRPPDPIWELVSSLSGRRYATPGSGGSREVDGLAEALTAELVSFMAPLRDDDAPYSLQPFLQRMNTWSVSVTAGHFSTSYPLIARTDWDAGFGAGVGFYPRPWLNVAGSLGYTYDELRDLGIDEKTHSFSGNGGAGVRFGDTLIRISYYFAKQQVSDASPPLRQGVQLSVFTILGRRFTVGLLGETIPQGAEGQLSLEYFPRQNLGIFASGLVAKGQLNRGGPLLDRLVGGLVLLDGSAPRPGWWRSTR